ncbi:PucR family transcriptional regulator [Nonomuraea basaltis]|uniref:PucR family transcriptional regulator n=1 Tax=Nonomuraea basaltis TaxID=2495887 RepID=UPI00110C5CEC|nr:helix-turn-helix domain-containing protein [Nonomuraea basaltis]TMR88870.1 PucR family transcriptional regulator [Nonomuraea basaltis]
MADKEKGLQPIVEPGGIELAGYPETLLDVAATGRTLSQRELKEFESAGATAAHEGLSLGATVDLFVRATKRAWPDLPRMARGRSGCMLDADAVATMGSDVLTAMTTAVGAVTSGYQQAQEEALRVEEDSRRRFIDDLLEGTGDISSLADRAERFGLQLVADHVVAVAEAARPFGESDRILARAEAALRAGTDRGNVLTAIKDGRILVIAPVAPPARHDGRAEAPIGAALARVVEQEASTSWRVAVGQPRTGVQGVCRSYRDCGDALQLAARLRFSERVVAAADLLLYRVVLRDAEVIADFIGTVLGPLVNARYGAEPLLETLDGYFASGCVTAKVARRFYLTERAVTYRLNRIRALTGHDVHVPRERLALEIALIGARYFDWPRKPLPVAS